MIANEDMHDFKTDNEASEPGAGDHGARNVPAICADSVLVSIATGRNRKTLISDVSLQIPAAHFAVIVGASGCGKSTLIKALAGTTDLSGGGIYLSGHGIRGLREHFPLAISYLPQFGAFHPNLTVRESLHYVLALRLPRSVSREVRANWLERIVEVSGIKSLLGQPYSTLSGGQMRRIALAEQLIGDPAFLLLDELTSGLDAYSDQEMMLWLRELAHDLGKTVVLVTHATYHLHYCDSILFLHQGRLICHGSYESLLQSHGVGSVTELFGLYQAGQIPLPEPAAMQEGAISRPPIEPQPIKTGRPPSGLWQFPILLTRQLKLFWRDKGQLWLHVALIVTFPCLVAVFAMHGLPQVRNLTLSLETNVLHTLQEQLYYLKESFHAASVISGLAMFQVVLLTLIGANNGAREIAKEDDILKKELRSGLSPAAYVSTKFLQIVGLCLIQAFWMAWFVKTVCDFPGNLSEQFGILFAAILAMSTTCLAISAAAPSPERASLLAIYLVGFQLPLSGAALSLPDWLSGFCRPFIVAYWGWSGYLQTFQSTRHYDIVKQSTHTTIADYRVAMAVMATHVVVSFALAVWFVGRKRRTG
jgi:ABC transport system ATP-binding/permease protein